MSRETCIPRPFPLKWRWKQSAGTIESISTTPAIPTVPPSALPTSRGCIRSSIEKSFSRLLKKGGGGAWLGPPCSRNPHDEAVVVRRAQLGTKPGHPLKEGNERGRRDHLRSLAAAFRRTF